MNKLIVICYRESVDHETDSGVLKYAYTNEDDAIKKIWEITDELINKFIDDEINDCDIFNGCYNLKSIDLSSYQGLKIVDRYYHGIHAMFSNTSMENIKLCPIECVGEECNYTNFLYRMFDGNPLLTYVDLTPLTSNGAEQYKTIEFLFHHCTNLKCVKMSGDFSNVIHYDKMFEGVETEGTLFYDKRYDYSKIIEQLPEKWQAIGLEY